MAIRSALVLLLLYGAAPAHSESPLEASWWKARGFELHGFADTRAGVRTRNDPEQKDESLAESRLQLELLRFGEINTWTLRADLLYDDVPDELDLDLEEGRGWLDLREANLITSPAYWMDLKIGRQILTWGTGDLLFINDLFPKDWQSFFAGRDEEYLKAPSDAVMASLFPGPANVDVAYAPRFDADRFISGRRLSYWNPVQGATAGHNAAIEPERPDDWIDDDEWAVRIYRNLGGYELALYAYDGYWKSPAGVDPSSTNAVFPRLTAAGASLRGTLAGGIVSIEAGHYESRDDAGGGDPFTPNSEQRYLLGYERELLRDLTAGLQAYLEHMQHYDRYLTSVPPGMPARDEDRAVLTLRLTRRMMNQNLTLSLFSYYSPTDQDAYLRPLAAYKATDHWQLSAGGNVFLGEEAHTFFGQFENNSNVYGALRYSF